ncbi:unnamed protein product [Periconia digitata]|uniref:Uncharacterized protein n=1 Tax=Periconia digitata TaxID=1303443 RepID=A0A9W4U4C0_9PLEO|nr:unnamed protein product [Periconia digitata]
MEPLLHSQYSIPLTPVSIQSRRTKERKAEREREMEISRTAGRQDSRPKTMQFHPQTVKSTTTTTNVSASRPSCTGPCDDARGRAMGAFSSAITLLEIQTGGKPTAY